MLRINFKVPYDMAIIRKATSICFQTQHQYLCKEFWDQVTPGSRSQTSRYSLSDLKERVCVMISFYISASNGQINT